MTNKKKRELKERGRSENEVYISHIAFYYVKIYPAYFSSYYKNNTTLQSHSRRRAKCKALVVKNYTIHCVSFPATKKICLTHQRSDISRIMWSILLLLGVHVGLLGGSMPILIN
jgi:hypothetical protein